MDESYKKATKSFEKLTGLTWTEEELCDNSEWETLEEVLERMPKFTSLYKRANGSYSAWITGSHYKSWFKAEWKNAIEALLALEAKIDLSK